MEAFELLQKKLDVVAQALQRLKTENDQYKKEITQLKKRISTLEDDILEEQSSIESLNSEKEKTKLFVADLIKNIDQLVEQPAK